MTIEQRLRATLADRAAEVDIAGLESADAIVTSGRRHRRNRRTTAAAAVLAIGALMASIAIGNTEPTTSITIADQPDTPTQPEPDQPSPSQPEPADPAEPTDAAEPGDATSQPDPADPAEPSDAAEPGDTNEPGVSAASPGAERLGRYLVARANAGEVQTDDGTNVNVPQIPVFDQPEGPPRTLIENNLINGTQTLMPIINWASHGSATVLRVVEGEPGDAWVRVQAPTRPHNQSVWVRASDFHWAETSRRIEIDLAGDGKLTIVDTDRVLLETPIVQGRASRPTPTHVTYLQAGVSGTVWARGPAYGDAILTIASWSEALGSFGRPSDGSPQNFLHGTNQPELMGQRVSIGEIRLTNDDLAQLIEIVTPGTPVLLFDSSDERPGRDEILSTPLVPATTVAYTTNGPTTNATERAHPQLWRTCDQPARVCTATNHNHPGFVYAVARPRTGQAEIPIYDEPGGEPRTAIDTNLIDGVGNPYPLLARTEFDQPTVLAVLDQRPGWLYVQLPIRPNGSAAWVRDHDFTLHTTDVFIEVSTHPTASEAPGGELIVRRGTTVLHRTIITSGRESRPTPNGVGWIHQIVPGESTSPAYGSWVFDVGLLSESLGSFGGDTGMPVIAIHGTNAPGTVGQRTHSGSVVTTNESLQRMLDVAELVGVPVVIHDQPGGLTSSDVYDKRQTIPARTGRYGQATRPPTRVFT